MFYLTQMLGTPVVDAAGETIGEISDIAIATGEVFPRVTSLAFLGPDKKPFMLSWRKFVEEIDEDRVRLNVPATDIRFSYLQPDEVLLHRDLLNKQIVDTQGMKVVRVNDLKLSESRNQLRLLGAEVGLRGILRGLHPVLERAVARLTRLVGRELAENLIAWNYMDLLDRDLSHVQLSVTHKRLHELHPADMADVLEQLSPSQRARVFEHLDNPAAALAVAALEDEFQADVIDDLGSQRASDILEMMDPDDAADIIGDLPYDKAEKLLRLMGVNEAAAVRALLGYREKTAGGIMTPEVTTVTEEMTVQEVIEHLREEAAENESIYYIFVVDDQARLTGVISLRDLVISEPRTPVADIVSRDVITVNPDDDQEYVAETMSKYDLLALPVVDETSTLLGIVTVDDALEVMEEESAEDLALATGSDRRFEAQDAWSWLGRKSGWLTVWLVLGVGAVWLLSAFEETFVSLIAAAFFMPLIIRLAEEISSHSLAVMIDQGSLEDRPSLGRRLVVDTLVGIGLGAVSGLIAFGMLELLGEPLRAAVTIALAVGGAVLVTAMAGALVPYVALREDGSGWRAPSALFSAGLAVVGLAVYLGLTALLDAALPA
ncbi:MAG: magnesium transporter [Anaerosomatales bacterium]|nr:magnesium transporter [Anaerosomatales bacterium]